MKTHVAHLMLLTLTGPVCMSSDILGWGLAGMVLIGGGLLWMVKWV